MQYAENLYFTYYIGSTTRDPVKTEYDKDQGFALVEPDEEAVELRSITAVMAAKYSAAIFCGTVQ